MTTNCRSVWMSLCAAASGALVGCGGHHFSYRYRLTIRVETPEGVRTGSGVLECRAFDTEGQFPQLDRRRGGAMVAGEAVVVDLGSRGLLFVLLSGGRRPYVDELSANAVVRAGLVRRGPELYTDFAKEVTNVHGEVAVLPSELPTLVRFRDIADPSSVEFVDPNDLTASFGLGVRLLGASIEMTSDPVTTGIEKQLGWLAALKGGYLDGQFAGGGPALSNILHGGNFKSSKGQ